MQDFINWCNQNQGVIMVGLTLVYVFTTFIMAFLMMRANRLTYSLEQQRVRPVVIFDMDPIHSFMFAILHNIGLSPACNIQVTTEPIIKEVVQGRERETVLTSHRMSFLAPGKKVKGFIDSNDSFYKKYEKPVFKGTIVYEDLSGNKYKETFTLDLNYHKEILSIKSKNIGDVAKELELIRKAVEKGVLKDPNPLVRTVDEETYQQQQEENVQKRLQQIEEHKKKRNAEKNNSD